MEDPLKDFFSVIPSFRVVDAIAEGNLDALNVSQSDKEKKPEGRLHVVPALMNRP